MFVTLKNSTGKTRIVEDGLSLAGLVFGGLLYFYRRMPVQGLLWTFLMFFTFGITNLIVMLKINKDTVFFYLNQGYQPADKESEDIIAKWDKSFISQRQLDSIEINTADISRQYKEVGIITTTHAAKTMFSKRPELEDINVSLKKEAIKKGANAVIKVQYKQGVSLTSWKALTATGVAIIVEKYVNCPSCAEPIKKEAIKCKHCGADLSIQKA